MICIVLFTYPILPFSTNHVINVTYVKERYIFKTNYLSRCFWASLYLGPLIHVLLCLSVFKGLCFVANKSVFSQILPKINVIHQIQSSTVSTTVLHSYLAFLLILFSWSIWSGWFVLGAYLIFVTGTTGGALVK